MNLAVARPHGSLLGAGVLALTLVAGGAAVALDGARLRVKRLQSQSEIRAIVGLLGTADLALSSASRWLRHPSLTEPGAPFADAPAVLDADPAGAMIAPPRELMAGTRIEP